MNDNINITDFAEKEVELIFEKAVKTFNLQSGDIEPSQAFELDDIKSSLSKMLFNFVKQNTSVSKTITLVVENAQNVSDLSIYEKLQSAFPEVSEINIK